MSLTNAKSSFFFFFPFPLRSRSTQYSNFVAEFAKNIPLNTQRTPHVSRRRKFLSYLISITSLSQVFCTCCAPRIEAEPTSNLLIPIGRHGRKRQIDFPSFSFLYDPFSLRIREISRCSTAFQAQVPINRRRCLCRIVTKGRIARTGTVITAIVTK